MSIFTCTITAPPFYERQLQGFACRFVVVSLWAEGRLLEAQSWLLVWMRVDVPNFSIVFFLRLVVLHSVKLAAAVVLLRWLLFALELYRLKLSLIVVCGGQIDYVLLVLSRSHRSCFKCCGDLAILRARREIRCLINFSFPFSSLHLLAGSHRFLSRQLLRCFPCLRNETEFIPLLILSNLLKGLHSCCPSNLLLPLIICIDIWLLNPKFIIVNKLIQIHASNLPLMRLLFAIKTC